MIDCRLVSYHQQSVRSRTYVGMLRAAYQDVFQEEIWRLCAGNLRFTVFALGPLAFFWRRRFVVNITCAF